MSAMLFIRKSDEIDGRLTAAQFQRNENGSYKVDAVEFEDLDVDTECPEGFRPVAVHIVPIRTIEGRKFYSIFKAKDAPPTLYVSLPIGPEDFLCESAENPTMSLAVTVVGKLAAMIKTVQSKFDITLSVGSFSYPKIINGEFIWPLVLEGDDYHVIDQWLETLGEVIGHAPAIELRDDPEGLNELSIAVLAHEAN